jgi:hypothetical protein
MFLAFIDFELVDNHLFVVCFLLGDSPASEIHMPTFRNTLSHLHRQVGVCRMNLAEGMLEYFMGKVWLGNGLSH